MVTAITVQTRPCKECGTPTTGSVGAAGIHWPFLCQPCKDKADAGELRRISAIARSHREVAALEEHVLDVACQRAAEAAAGSVTDGVEATMAVEAPEQFDEATGPMPESPEMKRFGVGLELSNEVEARFNRSPLDSGIVKARAVALLNLQHAVVSNDPEKMVVAAREFFHAWRRAEHIKPSQMRTDAMDFCIHHARRDCSDAVRACRAMLNLSSHIDRFTELFPDRVHRATVTGPDSDREFFA